VSFLFRFLFILACLLLIVFLLVSLFATPTGQHLLSQLPHLTMLHILYLLYEYPIQSLVVAETVLLIWWRPHLYTCVCGFKTWNPSRALSHSKSDHKVLVEM
jgi:hypothetical protein